MVGKTGELLSTLLYNLLVPFGRITHVDPVSKVGTLVTSTLIELARGGSYDYRLLVPGLILLIVGGALCLG